MLSPFLPKGTKAAFWIVQFCDTMAIIDARRDLWLPLLANLSEDNFCKTMQYDMTNLVSNGRRRPRHLVPEPVQVARSFPGGLTGANFEKPVISWGVLIVSWKLFKPSNADNDSLKREIRATFDIMEDRSNAGPDLYWYTIAACHKIYTVQQLDHEDSTFRIHIFPTLC